MATYPLNFLGFLFLLLVNFLLITTEAFPNYYYLTEGGDLAEPHFTEAQELPVSLHGYGIPDETVTEDPLVNQILDKLLQLKTELIPEQTKRSQAWGNGYGKRQHDWYATYGKRDAGAQRMNVPVLISKSFRKRQNGWTIGYGRK